MCWYGCDPATAPRTVSRAESERLAALTRERRERDRAMRTGSVQTAAGGRDASPSGTELIMTDDERQPVS
jgi:hypothetical protein